jgi:HSP20 family molecular chaperone IbpA
LEIAASDEIVTESDIAPLVGKANVLQRMNRFDDSNGLWDEVVEFREDQYHLRDDYESRYAYAMALNNRAYIEAQAKTQGNTNVDIHKSLEDIKLAMKIRGTQDDPVMVDTLGYLLLLNGDNEEALERLDGAVKRSQIENEAIKRKYRIEMHQAGDRRPLEQISEQLDQQYSVILHHRGEAYAALGESEKAEADIEEAKRLGYSQKEGIW